MSGRSQYDPVALDPNGEDEKPERVDEAALKRDPPRRSSRRRKTVNYNEDNTNDVPVRTPKPSKAQARQSIVDIGKSIPEECTPIVLDDLVMHSLAMGLEGNRGEPSNAYKHSTTLVERLHRDDLQITEDVRRDGKLLRHEMMMRFRLDPIEKTAAASYACHSEALAKCWQTYKSSRSARIRSTHFNGRREMGLYAGSACAKGSLPHGARGVVYYINGGDPNEEQEGVNVGFGVQTEKDLGGGRTKPMKAGTLLGPLRNANSSCDPNCVIVKSTTAYHDIQYKGGNRKGEVTFADLKALRGIEEGEELTFDYGPAYFKGQNLICACSFCNHQKTHDPDAYRTRWDILALPSSRRMSILTTSPEPDPLDYPDLDVRTGATPAVDAEVDIAGTLDGPHTPHARRTPSAGGCTPRTSHAFTTPERATGPDQSYPPNLHPNITRRKKKRDLRGFLQRRPASRAVLNFLPIEEEDEGDGCLRAATTNSSPSLLPGRPSGQFGKADTWRHRDGQVETQLWTEWQEPSEAADAGRRPKQGSRAGIFEEALAASDTDRLVYSYANRRSCSPLFPFRCSGSQISMGAQYCLHDRTVDHSNVADFNSEDLEVETSMTGPLFDDEAIVADAPVPPVVSIVVSTPHTIYRSSAGMSVGETDALPNFRVDVRDTADTEAFYMAEIDNARITSAMPCSWSFGDEVDNTLGESLSATPPGRGVDHFADDCETEPEATEYGLSFREAALQGIDAGLPAHTCIYSLPSIMPTSLGLPLAQNLAAALVLAPYCLVRRAIHGALGLLAQPRDHAIAQEKAVVNGAIRSTDFERLVLLVQEI